MLLLIPSLFILLFLFVFGLIAVVVVGFVVVLLE